MFELSVSLLFLAMCLDVPLNLYMLSLLFLSFSSIFSYPQPFFCTLAALSRFSRYSSSDLDRNDEKRAPKALPTAALTLPQYSVYGTRGIHLRPSDHLKQLHSAESRFPSSIERVFIFMHFIAFASNAFLDQENHPESSRRDSQSTRKGSPEAQEGSGAPWGHPWRPPAPSPESSKRALGRTGL